MSVVVQVKSSLTDSSAPDGSFCGDEKPQAYTSESHSLQLIFHTDDSIEKKVHSLKSRQIVGILRALFSWEIVLD